MTQQTQETRGSYRKRLTSALKTVIHVVSSLVSELVAAASQWPLKKHSSIIDILAPPAGQSFHLFSDIWMNLLHREPKKRTEVFPARSLKESGRVISCSLMKRTRARTIVVT